MLKIFSCEGPKRGPEMDLVPEVGLSGSTVKHVCKKWGLAKPLHWKSKINYTLNHSRNRVEIYAKEKFKFKIHEVKLL